MAGVLPDPWIALQKAVGFLEIIVTPTSWFCADFKCPGALGAQVFVPKLLA